MKFYFYYEFYIRSMGFTPDATMVFGKEIHNFRHIELVVCFVFEKFSPNV